jgi:hypothetical protein
VTLFSIATIAKPLLLMPRRTGGMANMAGNKVHCFSLHAYINLLLDLFSSCTTCIFSSFSVRPYRLYVRFDNNIS